MTDKKCQNFAEYLVLKVYGELDGMQARRLDSHLTGCQSCQAKLSELRAVQKEFSQLEAPAPSEAFVEKCVKSLGQRKKNAAPIKRPFLLWPLFSAATLLIAFVGYQAFFEQPVTNKREGWLTASPKVKQVAPVKATQAVTPNVRPIDKIRLPKESPPLVTAFVPSKKPVYDEADLLWNHNLEERLERLSDRLAALNRRANPSQKITSYSRISKRVSRLSLAIERL